MQRDLLIFLIAFTACRSPNPSDTSRGYASSGDREAGDESEPAGVNAAEECPGSTEPIVVSCDEPDPDGHAEAVTTTGDDKLTLHRAKFADLPGWADDDHADAVPAFLRSCEKLAAFADDAPVGTGPYGGKAGDWRRACAKAARVKAGKHAAARAFFEREFTPYAAHGVEGPIGKMTGYYVQALSGSFKRGGKNQFPLLSRPPDLVETQLSDFIGDGRSRRIWGRIDERNGHLVPYPTRGEVQPRKLPKNRVLMWVDSPVDAMSVEIEGSGKVSMDDGSEVWVHFAGKNGRRYRGTGGILRAMRKLVKSEGAQKGKGKEYRAYLEQAHTLYEKKDSIVFFQVEPRKAAIGTQDVILTPRRSLAVDRAVISLSTPVWVDTRAKSSAKGRTGPWQHLLIAQDTGGGILGTIRGDIYWGHDREAEAIGSRVNTKGRMWLLLPRSIKLPAE